MLQYYILPWQKLNFVVFAVMAATESSEAQPGTEAQADLFKKAGHLQ